MCRISDNYVTDIRGIGYRDNCISYRQINRLSVTDYLSIVVLPL